MFIAVPVAWLVGAFAGALPPEGRADLHHRVPAVCRRRASCSTGSRWLILGSEDLYFIGFILLAISAVLHVTVSSSVRVVKMSIRSLYRRGIVRGSAARFTIQDAGATALAAVTEYDER